MDEFVFSFSYIFEYVFTENLIIDTNLKIRFLMISKFSIKSHLWRIIKIKNPILKIKKEQIATIFVIGILLTMAVFGMYSGTRIDKYIAKNTDEAQIIALLNSFQKARKEYNLETYLACLSDNGKFMFGGSIMVSKKELRKLLPAFWEDRRTNHIKTRPSSREELNGNFFDGILYNPIIKVTKNKAKAVVTFVTPIIRWKTKLFLDFRKHNGFWQISRLEWDIG